MRTEYKERENVVLLLINNYVENKGSGESVGSTETGLRTGRSEVRILTEAIDLSLFLKVLFGMGHTRPPIQRITNSISKRLHD